MTPTHNNYCGWNFNTNFQRCIKKLVIKKGGKNSFCRVSVRARGQFADGERNQFRVCAPQQCCCLLPSGDSLAVRMRERVCVVRRCEGISSLNLMYENSRAHLHILCVDVALTYFQATVVRTITFDKPVARVSRFNCADSISLWLDMVYERRM